MSISSLPNPTAVVGRRVLAAVVDMVVLVVLNTGLFALIFRDQVKEGTSCQQLAEAGDGRCISVGDTAYQLSSGGSSASVLLSVGVMLLYLGVFQGIKGASLGKYLTGLRVVSDDGQICGWWRGVLRTLPLAVGLATNDLLLMAVYVVGAVLIFAHPRHQRVGDMLAGTFVVRRGAAAVSPVEE